MTRHTAQRFKGRDLLSKHQNRHQFFIYLHIEPASSHTQTAINIKSTSKQQQSLDVAKRLFFLSSVFNDDVLLVFMWLSKFRQNETKNQFRLSSVSMFFFIWNIWGGFSDDNKNCYPIAFDGMSLPWIALFTFSTLHWRRLPSLLDSSLLRFQECLHKWVQIPKKTGRSNHLHLILQPFTQDRCFTFDSWITTWRNIEHRQSLNSNGKNKLCWAPSGTWREKTTNHSLESKLTWDLRQSDPRQQD